MTGFCFISRERRRHVQSYPEPSQRNINDSWALTPDMTGPLVAGISELDGSEEASLDGGNPRRSTISRFSVSLPSRLSLRSRTSVSELAEDTFSEAGSYQQLGQRISAFTIATGLCPPPSVVKAEQRQWQDAPGASLDDKPGGWQLGRLHRSASAQETPSDTGSSAFGHESQDVGTGGLRIVSIFPASSSSRVVRDSASGDRFSVAELEGDSFFIPGREPAPYS